MSEIIGPLFFLFLLQTLVPFVQRRSLDFRRQSAIGALEVKRQSQVITLLKRPTP